MHKPWARRPRAQGEFMPPRDDINSPDLYIPGMSQLFLSVPYTDVCNIAVMAIVTYILLAALHAGINSRFNPRVCLTFLEIRRV